jgi:DNA-binding response OmpR family regulator
MNWNQISRVHIESRIWATRLGLVALLILLSGGNREANAIMVFPGGGVDEPLSAVRPTSSFSLPGLSIDIQGPPTSHTVDLHGRSPITPVSPSPSSGLLFVTALLGILGMAVQRETLVQRVSSRQSSDPHRPRSAGSVIVLSHDGELAGTIGDRLRRAGYAVQISTAVSEILAVSNPATTALVLIDQRIQDWDMLRTDPHFWHVQLIMMVPLGAIYTDEHCLSDLERGIDGVHDLRDGYGLLVAKVGAYLRRAVGSRLPRGNYQLGAVEFDGDSQEVKVAGQPVHLSAKPLAILEALIREPAKLFTRNELTHLLWGQNFAIGEHTLDVHLHALRRQLARDPDRLCQLVTIKGVGFKLKLAASADPMTRGEASRGQYRDPIHLHNRGKLRCANRHLRRGRATDPARRIEGNGGKTSSIRRYVTAPAPRG